MDVIQEQSMVPKNNMIREQDVKQALYGAFLPYRACILSGFACGSECPAEILRRIRRDFDAELLGTLHDLRKEDPFPGEEYGRVVLVIEVVI